MLRSEQCDNVISNPCNWQSSIVNSRRKNREWSVQLCFDHNIKLSFLCHFRKNNAKRRRKVIFYLILLPNLLIWFQFFSSSVFLFSVRVCAHRKLYFLLLLLIHCIAHSMMCCHCTLAVWTQTINLCKLYIKRWSQTIRKSSHQWVTVRDIMVAFIPTVRQTLNRRMNGNNKTNVKE